MSQPHDKTGRKCSVCNKPFSAQSMTLSIRVKKAGIVERRICCTDCYEDHYGGGE